MDIIPAGSQASVPGNPDYFTGQVYLDPIVSSHPPSQVNAARVTFAPGARTAWHTHPLGQTLHVLTGEGRVCVKGEAPRVIRPGDTVWIPPGEVHWHGAGPDTMMTHIAVQEAVDGSAADWLEPVSDADYATSAD
ncbi:cupin domain-containing protein [Chachezhania antarctica]|uniref:(R)-mandelonitrile lyase n=1 Tax=Chachezhania antarctica TaxID=2340860 RepID=UPI000EB42F75|nr:cupin domain-containing protein [Chachezhania antarctica]|tara:strand:+ start:512 stop:916 length:405 start_codon:yes stop_codon:yes gene_type:complete